MSESNTEIKGRAPLSLNVASWMIILGASIALLMFFKGFFRPIVTAIILWYMILELRQLIGRLKIGGRSIPVWINSVLSTVIVILILYGTIDIIVLNIEKLASNFPTYSQNISGTLRNIEQVLGLEKMDELFADQSQAIQKRIASTASSFADFLGKFFLIVIYLIFLFIEERPLHRRIAIIVERSKNSEAVRVSLQRIVALFHNYISVKIFTSFLTGVLSFVVLLLLGIELPGLWAFMIFLLNFIPTVGSMVATLFPAVFSILQFGELSHFVLVVVFVGLVQLFVGNFLEPRMMGSRLNISPIVILVSLTFWGFIWGIVGMILAVPIMAILIIICSQIPKAQPIAIMLSKNGDIDLPDSSNEVTNDQQ